MWKTGASFLYITCSATIILNIYSAFVKYFRKKRKYNEAVHKLYIDLKKAYDSVRREVLYNILFEFVLA